MDVEDDNVSKCKRSSLNAFVKKSISSIGLAVGNQNLLLREAKSFTGAIEELKGGNKHNVHDGSIYCHKQIYATDHSCNTGQISDKGYETMEVTSNQIFLVKEEMLTYRGKRYSLTDIAQKWKKDCRMWLWKGNKHKKNQSVIELREKLQNIKIYK